MTTPFEALSAAKKREVRRLLRREFTKFFTTMTTDNGPSWPEISHQEFVDALADSLLQMGQDRQLGVAYLQTLVHELQDRINSHLN